MPESPAVPNIWPEDSRDLPRLTLRQKGVADVPLARILRLPHPDPERRSTRGPTRSSPRACTRSSGPSRPTATGSASVGTAPPTRRASSTAPNRPGTTATSASSPATSVRPCSSRISGRRSAAPCSRPTVTPSAMTAGCSCTTDTSTSSQRSNATSSSPSTHRSIHRSKARPTPRCCSFSPSPSASRTTRRPLSSRRSGSSKRSPVATGCRTRSRARSRPPTARRIWAFRYSSERNSRSLFYTTDVPTLRKLYPGRQLFQEVSDNARLIVSEPLGDVAGVWNEVPESTYGIVGPDHAEMRPFQPKAPSTPARARSVAAWSKRKRASEAAFRRETRRPLDDEVAAENERARHEDGVLVTTDPGRRRVEIREGRTGAHHHQHQRREGNQEPEGVVDRDLQGDVHGGRPFGGDRVERRQVDEPG